MRAAHGPAAVTLLGVVAAACAREPQTWTWSSGDWGMEHSIVMVRAGGGRLVAAGHGEGVGFIAMLDAGGEVIWTRNLAGPTGEANPRAVTVADDGFIYLGGSFVGSVPFGDGSEATLASQTCNTGDSWSNCPEAFAASYDQDGELRWIARFQEPGARVSRVNRVVVAGEVVVVAGAHEVAVAESAWDTPFDVDGDLFLAGLDRSGKELWRRLDPVGPGRGLVHDLVVAGSDAILASIEYRGDPEVGDPPASLLVGLGSDGQEAWRRDALHGALSLAPSGDVIVAGTFTEAIQFGARTVTPLGASDIFVVRYSAAEGELRWGSHLGAAEAGVSAADVDVAAAGDVFIVGSVAGQLTIGSSTLRTTTFNDVLVARLRGDDGQPMQAASVGTSGPDDGLSLLLLGDHDLAVAGTFTGDLPLGDGLVLPSRGLADLFAIRADLLPTP